MGNKNKIDNFDIRSDFFAWIYIPRLIQDVGLEGNQDHSLRSTVPKCEPDKELLPELSGLLPLHKHSRGGIRALPVLQEKLRDHLPRLLGREMGWAEGSRYVSLRPHEVN